MKDEDLKRAGQILNTAQEVFPDKTAQYSAFVTGAIWADNHPASDHEWHKVGDGVDPTEDCEDTNVIILFLDGYRKLYATSIATIEDVYSAFNTFVEANDVRYWSYARAFVPDFANDEQNNEAMDKSRDEEE